jgi:hypothetical protein
MYHIKISHILSGVFTGSCNKITDEILSKKQHFYWFITIYFQECKYSCNITEKYKTL